VAGVAFSGEFSPLWTLGLPEDSIVALDLALLSMMVFSQISRYVPLQLFLVLWFPFLLFWGITGD